MPLQDANPTPSFGGFGFSLERFAPERGSEHTYDVLRKEVPVAVYLIEWWRTRRSPRDIDATQQEQ